MLIRFMAIICLVFIAAGDASMDHARWIDLLVYPNSHQAPSYLHFLEINHNGLLTSKYLL